MSAGSPARAGTDPTARGLASKALSASASGGFPGYISGNWYLPMGASVNVGFGWSAGQIRAVPFLINSKVTLAAFGSRVTTISAGGNAQFAIYKNNPTTMRPTGLPIATTPSLSTGTAANISAAPNEGPITLNAGLYWFAANADNSVVVMQAIGTTTAWSSALVGSPTESAVDNANTNVGLTFLLNGTFGTWPDLTSTNLVEAPTSGAILHFKAQ